MSDDEVEDEKYSPILVSQRELSARLGLTTRWIYDLTKDGVLVQISGKKYDLDASHKAYREYLLAKADEKKAPSASDSLTRRKEERLQRQMDRENRVIIRMDEAMKAVDLIVGAFSEAISGLPARITRNIDERKRIETICDGVRASLDKAFGETRTALRTGSEAGSPVEEDDA